MIKNYIITTWDDEHHTIDNENAEKLIDAWTAAERPFPIDLGGVAISSSHIKSITPNHITEADILPEQVEGVKRLEAGGRCRGQYSIQNEINHIAKNDFPKSWPKKIKDKKWREETRLKLRASQKVWCDHRLNECACEKSYLSERAKFDKSIR